MEPAAGASGRRRTYSISAKLLVWPILLALGPIGSAWSQQRDARDQAQALLIAANQAFESGKLDLSRQRAEAAYRLVPSPRILHHLATIEAARGHVTAAADLARRALADLPAQVPDGERAAAQRLAGQRRGPTAEVAVAGPLSAWVYLDDRLVGTLPLSLPLLLTPGAHVLRLEGGGQTTTRLLAAQQGERLSLALGLPVPVLALPRQDLRPVWAGLRGRLAAALSDGADATLVKAEEGQVAGCGGALPCLRQLAGRLGARHLLLLGAGPSASGCALTAELLPVSGPALGARREVSLSSCDDDFSTPLVALAQEVIGLRSHQGGVLRVRATGRAALATQVRVDDWLAGPPPLSVWLRPAEHRVLVERDGKVVTRSLITLRQGELTLALSEERAPRSRWRLLSAAALGASAGALAGVGGWLWRLDGQRIPAPGGGFQTGLNEQGNPRFLNYDTLAPGVGLVSAGLTGAVAGLLLALIPGRARVVSHPWRRS